MKKSCPACAEEIFLAGQCSEILVVRSIKTYTSPVNRLCADHRHKRKRADANEVTIELRPVRQEQMKCREDGYYWCTAHHVTPPTRPKSVGGITGKLQRRSWARAYNAWLKVVHPFIAESRDGEWSGWGTSPDLCVIDGPLEPPMMSVKIDGARQ